MTAANLPRMYSDLAWTWRLISPPEDYIPEALEYASLIRQYASKTPRSWLHLGCGGGHLDLTLKKYFTITALDLSPEMLALAKALNPEVHYGLGDMRTVQLEQHFDAILVADSIDYMVSEADLKAVFACAYAHLVEGGVFCTCLEYTRERFIQNETQCSNHTQVDVHIALTENDFDPNPDDTSFEATFIYLIRRPTGIEVQTDLHKLGLFPLSSWQDWLQAAGFEVKTLTSQYDYPLLIGLK